MQHIDNRRASLDQAGIRDMADLYSTRQWVLGAPKMRLEDLRGVHGAALAHRLDTANVIKADFDEEQTILEAFKGSGIVAVAQYEGVRAAQGDPTVIEVVARSDASDTETSAAKAKDTDPHQDGYQFWCLYCGYVIAGAGKMPTKEVLSYPLVTEDRAICFADALQASRKFLKLYGPVKFGWLGAPVFTINEKYRMNDPLLEDAGMLSVITRDQLGWRFSLGGSIETKVPEAGFALNLFRNLLAKTAIIEPILPSTTYVVHQRTTVHWGLRLPGQSGTTLLRRHLLRHLDEEGLA